MVTTGSENHTRYLHHDHLGSINKITDANHNIIERRSFDAFGRVRQPNWRNTLALLSSPIPRGYTGHENIGFGLVHMNGRVYDPDLGRFLSPDPYIQNPKNLQSYNRYSYVMNNPLSYVDPSGYFFRKAWRKAKKTVKRATKVARSTAQSFVNINGAALRAINSNKITGTLAQTAACSYSPAACGAYVGLSTYAETGSFKQGLVAGLSAAATSTIANSELSYGEKFALHAAVGVAGSQAAGSSRGGGSSSGEEAARNRLSKINPISVYEDREYAGLIYKNNNRFFATPAVPGDYCDVGAPCSSNPFDALSYVPDTANIIGIYHTHGAAPSTAPNMFSNFSPADVRLISRLYENYGINNSYLATPQGKMILDYGHTPYNDNINLERLSK